MSCSFSRKTHSESLYHQHSRFDSAFLFNTPAFSSGKYVNNANQINTINELIEERNLETWILMRQGDFLNCDEQFMRRFYPENQYCRKVQGLTQYYKFHRNIPKIFDTPVQKMLGYYYHKRRHLDYKDMKKQLKQQQGINMTTQKSQSSFSITIQQQAKRSHYSNMLGPLNDNSDSDSKFLHCFCEKADQHLFEVNNSEQKNFKKKKGFRPSYQNTDQNIRKHKKNVQINFQDIQPIEGGNDTNFQAYLSQFFIKLQQQQKYSQPKYKLKKQNNFLPRKQFHHRQNDNRFRKSVLKGKTPHQSLEKQSHNNKYNSDNQRLSSLKTHTNLNRHKSRVRKQKQKSKQQKSSNNQVISHEDQNQAVMKNTNRFSRGLSKKKLINLKEMQNHNPNIERVSVTRSSNVNLKRKSNLKGKILQKVYGIQSNENSKDEYLLDKQKTMQHKKKSSTLVFKKERKLSSANLKKNQMISVNDKAIDRVLQTEQQYERRRSKSMKRILKPAASNIQFGNQNRLKEKNQSKWQRNNQNKLSKLTEGSTTNLFNKKVSAKSLFRSNSTNHNKPKTHRQLHKVDNFAKQNQASSRFLKYSSSNFVKDYNFFNNGSKCNKNAELYNNRDKQLTLQGLLNKKLENITKPIHRII